MKLKLAIASLLVLGTSGCVTSTQSYTQDIVYRDGSYYSPADDEYGDYYYAPEPDYSYYDDYSYLGYGSSFYGNSWYGLHDSYRCRFSYHYDRYCNNGWADIFLNFGAFSLTFGNSHYYGYDYGYPYYGYNTPYYVYYPPRTEHRNPIPMPKPRPVQPNNQIPDVGSSNAPGMRVPGESVWMPTKPGMLGPAPETPVVDDYADTDEGIDLNPYTRTREPRQTPRRPVRPEYLRSSPETGNEAGIRLREPREPRPDGNGREAVVISGDAYPVINTHANDRSSGNPIRRDGNPRPPPINPGSRQDTQAVPRSQNRERVERIERTERAAPVIRSEKTKEGDERL